MTRTIDRTREICFAAFAVWTLTVALPARGQPADDRPIALRIDFTHPAGRIANDFLGFGYETSAVAQPDFFSARNRRMIQLYKNLSAHGLIRIGGNVSDHTRFIPDGAAAARTEREVTIINRHNLADLGDFARATGWQVMWGLNLGTGTKQEAVDEAVAVDQALGPALHSFEVGNEVDLMQKYARNFDAYHADYTDFKSAIRARLPRAIFSGPDAAGDVSFVDRFVAAESDDMKLATLHYYRGGARNPNATMDRLLAHDAGLDERLEKVRSTCAAHRVGFRINEVNSFSGGGKPGVSDTFGSALWCLDFMFDLAAHGCQGVNMETDVNQLGFISFYSPVVHDAAGVCSARPEYYAMLAFAMAGHGDLLNTTFDAADENLRAYATKDDRGAVYLTIINKNAKRDATVECALPGGHGTAYVFRLEAPSIDATTGTRLGGAAVNADDGTWSALPPERPGVSGNAVRVKLPHASAVVVSFTK